MSFPYNPHNNPLGPFEPFPSDPLTSWQPWPPSPYPPTPYKIVPKYEERPWEEVKIPTLGANISAKSAEERLMGKPDVFDRAKAITLQSREDEYGHPLINFLRIALRWSNWLGVKVTPADVAFMMIDTKLARENHVHKLDNIDDIVGYASCWERIDNYMRDELGYESGCGAFDDMGVPFMQNLYNRLLDRDS